MGHGSGGGVKWRRLAQGIVDHKYDNGRPWVSPDVPLEVIQNCFAVKHLAHLTKAIVGNDYNDRPFIYLDFIRNGSKTGEANTTTNIGETFLEAYYTRYTKSGLMCGDGEYGNNESVAHISLGGRYATIQEWYGTYEIWGLL